MAKESKELSNDSIGEDLCKLADWLIKEGLCANTGSLNAAGSLCIKKAGEPQWDYKFGDLDFKIDEVGGTIPTGATDLTLRFSMDIMGMPESKDNNITNPLLKLIFDIEISGSFYDPAIDKVRDLFCSWHLDKNVGKEGDAKTKFSHPEYHFTFGGNKMEGKGEIYGSTLILPSPRIAHPPMDAVLGVDFILNNYFHKDHIKKIVTNPEYTEMVKKSQNRLWKPYFKSVSSKWQEYPAPIFGSTFTYNDLWPFLQKN